MNVDVNGNPAERGSMERLGACALNNTIVNKTQTIKTWKSL